MDIMIFNNSSHSAWHSKATSQISTKRWALTCPSSFTTPSWSNWELLTNQRKSKVNSTRYFTIKVQAYLMDLRTHCLLKSKVNSTQYFTIKVQAYLMDLRTHCLLKSKVNSTQYFTIKVQAYLIDLRTHCLLDAHCPCQKVGCECYHHSCVIFLCGCIIKNMWLHSCSHSIDTLEMVQWLQW